MAIRRIFYKGGYYHIYNRGSKKAFLYGDKWDYSFFMKKLSVYRKETEDIVSAYCLMPNHFHLILKASSKNSISKFIQLLCLSYATYYNKKYHTSGHVFQSRFQSKKIDSPEYIIYLSRYIHRNPLEAGLIKTHEMERYIWSSYCKYLNLEPKSKVKIDLKPILKYFNGIEEYKEYCLMEDLDSYLCLRDMGLGSQLSHFQS